ncbi:hypothetical protein GQ43DRAFT_434167 [Delitschia confertaspora ATCC 74209]|uniref:Uncharacterized protein n=1 Tax=Delitschia confertaspora ATCC 74209 TaxID=1513339 RepID=A0A9P4JK02_9PLEO|nr:hypothetical protein GQ43DRAFT_434167 [Delitschia confertaspora ATCC 74209]
MVPSKETMESMKRSKRGFLGRFLRRDTLQSSQSTNNLRSIAPSAAPTTNISQLRATRSSVDLRAGIMSLEPLSRPLLASPPPSQWRLGSGSLPKSPSTPDFHRAGVTSHVRHDSNAPVFTDLSAPPVPPLPDPTSLSTLVTNMARQTSFQNLVPTSPLPVDGTPEKAAKLLGVETGEGYTSSATPTQKRMSRNAKRRQNKKSLKQAATDKARSMMGMDKAKEGTAVSEWDTESEFVNDDEEDETVGFLAVPPSIPTNKRSPRKAYYKARAANRMTSVAEHTVDNHELLHVTHPDGTTAEYDMDEGEHARKSGPPTPGAETLENHDQKATASSDEFDVPFEYGTVPFQFSTTTPIRTTHQSGNEGPSKHTPKIETSKPKTAKFAKPEKPKIAVPKKVSLTPAGYDLVAETMRRLELQKIVADHNSKKRAEMDAAVAQMKEKHGIYKKEFEELKKSFEHGTANKYTGKGKSNAAVQDEDIVIGNDMVGHIHIGGKCNCGHKHAFKSQSAVNPDSSVTWDPTIDKDNVRTYGNSQTARGQAVRQFKWSDVKIVDIPARKKRPEQAVASSRKTVATDNATTGPSNTTDVSAVAIVPFREQRRIRQSSITATNGMETPASSNPHVDRASSNVNPYAGARKSRERVAESLGHGKAVLDDKDSLFYYPVPKHLTEYAMEAPLDPSTIGLSTPSKTDKADKTKHHCINHGHIYRPVSLATLPDHASINAIPAALTSPSGRKENVPVGLKCAICGCTVVHGVVWQCDIPACKQEVCAGCRGKEEKVRAERAVESWI